MIRAIHVAAFVIVVAGSAFAEDAPRSVSPARSSEPTLALRGHVVTVDGVSVPNARAKVRSEAAISDAQGDFRLQVPSGENTISISANGYAGFSVPVSIFADTDMKFELQLSVSTTVNAQVDTPALRASNQPYESSELLQAAPGQPGVAVILPGYPSETASGGVKAPQYFAPGKAGDHGEPIAQYIRVGGFLFPNNLPANAHGNGYADPNLLIPAAVSRVESDAGAFDVRHGNNAVDLAVGYGLAPRLEPFFQVSADPRKYDLVSALSPRNPQTAAWLGFEVAGGDGFLDLPEHRHQYKINGERYFVFGHNVLTLFGAGHKGQSRIPGLVPIDSLVSGDTIDPRQSDHTHTELLVASDTWQLSDHKQLEFSEYFRTYGLDLKSNFGDGLIRQSEFRTVSGGNTSYADRMNSKISFSAGLDFRRDSPRNAQLSRADGSGAFHPVTRNDFVISDLAPYASIDGSLSRFVSYNLGLRRDEIWFDNTDRLAPSNSDSTASGIASPRGTFSFHLPGTVRAPILTFSSGEAFHTNDPRMGMGTGHGTLIATSHANQLVVTDTFFATQFRLALARVSNSQEFAKIDPDTGLQENVGPSLIHSLTISARRKLPFAYLQATFARATATDLLTRQDVPEAPRLIWDISATSIRLSWHLQASGGVEYVGRKPLGDGFNATPVKEIRGAFTRSFVNGLEAGIHFVAASGYTGQNLETLQLPNETAPAERIVGVRQASYAGITLTYRLHRQ